MREENDMKGLGWTLTCKAQNQTVKTMRNYLYEFESS